MQIYLDDLQSLEIAHFLEAHIQDMLSISPPESKHALDLNALRNKAISFWTIYEDAKLLGCGALKQLSSDHAEIKSMRTLANMRGKGVASNLLNHIIKESQNRGYKKISLETGSMNFFVPARKLYEKFGFTYCEPFADYKLDPYSLFMMKNL
jgi:putative acetyltransferase